MEDFIQPKQKKIVKKNHFKETVFIVLMIICLGIGFISGYIIRKTNIDTNNRESNT